MTRGSDVDIWEPKTLPDPGNTNRPKRNFFLTKLTGIMLDLVCFLATFQYTYIVLKNESKNLNSKNLIQKVFITLWQFFGVFLTPESGF